MELEKDKKLVLFDGVCNFCNASVNFIIKHDHRDKIRFASLQSEIGQKILKEHNLPLDNFDTFILVENGRIYTKSTAALKVAKELEGLWKYFYGFRIVPSFLRNPVYDIVAKNRYRIFGKSDSCMLPTPAYRKKFPEMM